MSSSSKYAKTVADQELLLAIPPWAFREYARCCSGCYEACRVLEMAVDGSSRSIYDRQGLSKDTCIGTYTCLWRALRRSCPGGFLNIPYLDMSFVHNATKVEYVRCIHKMLRPDSLSESKVVNLCRCCLPCTISWFYPTWEKESRGPDLEIEVRKSSKGLLIGWHDIERFAVSPARQRLVYAATQAFWHDLESLRRFYCGYAVILLLLPEVICHG